MSTSNRSNHLNSTELEHAKQLEAIVRRFLDTYVEVGKALADIADARLYGDIHQMIEAYVRDRRVGGAPSESQHTQGADPSDELSADVDASLPAAEAHAPEPAALPDEPSQALAKLCERLLEEFGGEDVAAAEIRLIAHKRELPGEPSATSRSTPGSGDQPEDGELLSELRWALSRASGTVADVAHMLETRATDIDDDARDQLRDDVLAVDEELAALKALLAGPVDWDAEYERLLAGKIPPFEHDDEDEHSPG